MILGLALAALAADGIDRRTLVEWIGACQEDQAAACLSLGLVYAQGSPPIVPVNLTEAERWLERACGAGMSEGCLGLGAVRETLAGAGDGASFEGARDAYGQACEANNLLACAAEAALYERGVVAGEPQPLRERACAGAHGPSCVALGMALEGARDPEGALAAYHRGCEAGAPDACAALGAMQFLGPRALRDPEAGRANLALACEAGLGETCALLGARAESEDAALDWWRQGCEREDAWSCWKGAQLLRRDSEEESAELLEAACGHGLDKACRKLERAFPAVDEVDAPEAAASD